VENISIVIPNYNGRKLLKKYLPSVLNACKYYSSEKTELIIVDDASSDGTVDYLKSHFPLVKLIKQPVNRGFSLSANRGISFAKNRIVVLLNNDVQVAKDFLLFLPQHFEDRDVFAVGLGLEATPEDVINDLQNPRIGGRFRFGFFDVPKETKKKTNLAFFAGGGAAAFDREKFMKLGGFDGLFFPFYYEDVDLSYRAWRRGWKIAYEPRSLAYHQGGGTISKFYHSWYISMVGERNRYFLVWKNITDRRLLIQHLIFIPLRLAVCLLKGKITSLIGLLCALRHLREVLRKRRFERKFAELSDSQIFNLFKE